MNLASIFTAYLHCSLDKSSSSLAVAALQLIVVSCPRLAGWFYGGYTSRSRWWKIDSIIDEQRGILWFQASFFTGTVFNFHPKKAPPPSFRRSPYVHHFLWGKRCGMEGGSDTSRKQFAFLRRCSSVLGMFFFLSVHPFVIDKGCANVLNLSPPFRCIRG